MIITTAVETSVYRSCQQVLTGYGTGEYTLPICLRGNKRHLGLFECQKSILLEVQDCTRHVGGGP
jgi:hypothetical protein